MSACTADSTQLLVLVNSDLSVREELTAVRVLIRDDKDAVLASHLFELSETEARRVSGQFVLPVSFGVLPRADDPGSSVVIDVDAVGTSRERLALFTRRSVAGFIADRSVMLPMFLARRCVNSSCPALQTCTEDGCVTVGGTPDRTNCVDEDGDSFYAGPACPVASDCDDTDKRVHPGAIEIPGDGKDNDCQGGDAPSLPPNDCTPLVDKDRDGYYDPILQGEQIPRDCLGRDCFDEPTSHPCLVDEPPPDVCLDSEKAQASDHARGIRGRQIFPGRREIVDNGIDDDCDPSTED